MHESEKPALEYQAAFSEMKKDKPDVKLAFDLLTSSADAGYGEANYALATWFLHGANGVDTDLKKGADLLKLAKDKGSVNAMYDLAVCYEEGKGVEQCLRKAFELYLMAALRGEKQSVYEVGRCYYYGVGVRKDKRVAELWLERAEELDIT